MRFLHISATLAHHIDPKTGLRTTVVMRPGRTYRRKKTQMELALAGCSSRQRRRIRKLVKRERKEHA